MKKTQSQPIAVLGAGSWGTALALYLSRQGQIVRYDDGRHVVLFALLVNELGQHAHAVGIETDRRFVQEKDFASRRQGSGDG